MGQFGLLDQMQRELDQESLPVDVQLLGVNAQGLESDNSAAVSGKTIPWLQDTSDVNAWVIWGVTWRDVYVLDRENRLVAVYNLNEHTLGNPADYDSLKAILRRAAQ